MSTGSGSLGDALDDQLAVSDALDIERFDDRDALENAVERGVVEGGIVIPSGYDATLREGGTATVEYVAKPGDFSGALKTTVDSAISDQASEVRAARVATAENAGSFDEALSRASALSGTLDGAEVDYEVAGGAEVATEGQFDTGASTQLVLFMFVNSLAGAAVLVQSRKLGMLRRMLSTPTRASTILLGETLGKFLVAMSQGVFIVLLAALLFGVDWGSPLGAAAIVMSFALVSTGAAVLFGSLLSNEQQAGALVPFGLALAALGGCMVPLEVFSDTMRTIAHMTPHAWANDAFNKLITRDAGFTAVLSELGVLLTFAAGLLMLATWRLRKSIVGSGAV